MSPEFEKLEELAKRGWDEPRREGTSSGTGGDRDN
jgi:hypothetical protein